MTEPIEQLIDIYPPSWPGKALPVQPGDLRLFAPSGAVDVGLAPGRASAHDSHGDRPADPLRAAPLTEPAGGAVYIQGEPAPADLASLMRLLRVDAAAADYAAFLARAADPLEDRFLAQLRLIRVPALVGIYQALSPDETRLFPDQRLTIGELVPAFVADERQRWSARPVQPPTADPGELRAQPALAFGFMVENAHYGVYRIWSRVWLLPESDGASSWRRTASAASSSGRSGRGRARSPGGRPGRRRAGLCPWKRSRRRQFAAAIDTSR